MAVIPGHSKADELVIFSAHYDHIGTTTKTLPHSHSTPEENGNPEPGDVIYNGANDNASGTTTLIHLARYFAKQQNNERTLVFIAFSGEEEGLLGSFALSPFFISKKVITDINMDMVGRPISARNQNPYMTGTEYSDLKKILNKKLFSIAPQYGSSYFKKDKFLFQMLFYRSDNYPFALKHFIAHTIMCTSPRDIYYHSLNDEWETLDYNFMAKVVKAIALGSSGLADGTDTPKKSKIKPLRWSSYQ
jgi:Zn-dependent M28 family amino/carboxypeptidase